MSPTADGSPPRDEWAAIGPERQAKHRHRRAPSCSMQAEALKERIYVSFTTLSVLIAMQAERAPSVTAAAITLSVTVAGTLLAVFLADILSHVTVRTKLPTHSELTQMLRVSLGAAPVLAAPLLSLTLAAFHLWSTTTALRIAVALILAALILIGFLAIRRA